VKRITVWIDSRDESVEQVREELKKYLAKAGLTYKILENSELIGSENE
jgi:hypothetical protein